MNAPIASITLTINGQNIILPLHIFAGCIFESLSHSQQQYVLDRCALAMQKLREQSERPSIYMPEQ